MNEIDLDAYCPRIGYEGPRTATLATLRVLHRLHAEAIAFENLDPFLGRPVLLTPEALDRKLIRSRRGGYCFEQNRVFGWALGAMGFDVSYRAARVLWGREQTAQTMRSHMVLQVDIDDETYIADVGFGGLTMTAPLRLARETEQATPHEPFRLSSVDGDHLLQAKVGSDWRSLYRFDDCPQWLIDYEQANWYVSTHPQSPFVTGLMAARPLPDRRYALSNNRVSVHHLNGATEHELLRSPREIRQALDDLFGVDVPDVADADARFQGLIG
jgi:N-hydroxyarylamine O-acetyltransferase